MTAVGAWTHASDIKHRDHTNSSHTDATRANHNGGSVGCGLVVKSARAVAALTLLSGMM
jgi:hypothetical protein